MSRAYGMNVEIKGAVPANLPAIRETARGLWPFEDWSGMDELISSYGESNLCGGESEQEFTDRLAEAIWLANGEYCQVVVSATCLEDLPLDTHIRDEASYTQWQRKGEKGGSQ